MTKQADNVKQKHEDLSIKVQIQVNGGAMVTFKYKNGEMNGNCVEELIPKYANVFREYARVLDAQSQPKRKTYNH
mgnify:CR=1 FL=1